MALPMLHLLFLHESMLRAARPLEHLVWGALTDLFFSQKAPFESGSMCFDTYAASLASDVPSQLKLRYCQADDVQGWWVVDRFL